MRKIYLLSIIYLTLLLPCVRAMEAHQFQQIDKNKVKSISYLLAEGKGIGQSIFGHSYIRIGYHNDPQVSDQVIEFVADIKEGEYDIIRGIGLTEPFPFTIETKRYSDTYNENVIQAQRNLITYSLVLTEEQKDLIIEELNSLLALGTTKKYKFFTENCLSYIRGIFEKAFNIQLSGMNAIFPNTFHRVLEENGLIKEEYIDHSFNHLRFKKLKNHRTKLDIESRKIFSNALKKLMSNQLNERLIGYIQLLEIKNSKITKNVRESISIFTSIIDLENRYFQNILYSLFSKKDASLEEVIELKIALNNKDQKSKIKNERLTVRSDDVFLLVRVGGEQTKSENILIPLPGLLYKNGAIYDEKDDILAIRVNSPKLKEEFIPMNTFFYSDIKREGHRNFLVFKWQKLGVDHNMNARPLDRSYEIAFKNRATKENPQGFCLGHTLLAKYLATRAVFLPDEERLKSSDYISIIESLLNGNIGIFPGMSSPHELTQFIGEKAVIDILNRLQWANVNKTVGFSYFSNITKLENKNIFIIKNLLALGTYPVLAFQVNGNLGHAVLVTEIKYLDDNEIELSVIDPNKSYQEGLYKYSFNSQTLDTAFYGKVKPLLLNENLGESISIRNLLVNSKSKKQILQIHKEHRTSIISPNTFYY